MAVCTYADASNNLQETIRTILAADATLLTFTNLFLDGRGVFKTRGTGIPRVEIHTPTRSESQLTLFKRQIILTVPIVVVDKKESNVREMQDAVLNALKTNVATTRGNGFFLFGNDIRTTQATSFLDNESSQYLWSLTISIPYSTVVT